MKSLINLQAYIIKPDRDNLLDASAILRLLLLDAYPLVHRVNRNYKMKITFPFVSSVGFGSSVNEMTYMYVNMSPIVGISSDVVELPLDEFLSQAAIIGGRSYSVRETIDFCANTKGGVHFDDPKSDSSKGLLELDSVHLPEFVDASLHAIADLSWCVIQGLKPLALKIESNYACT